ncbi:MAG: hypothetical protein RIC51_08285 [Erythrobacter sp.]
MGRAVLGVAAMRMTKLAKRAAMLAAITLATAAEAQRLDDSECRNALYHFEDMTVSPAHMSRILLADSLSYCETFEGKRTCMTGQEVYDDYLASIKRLGITRIGVTRMALFPELVGAKRAACIDKGDGTSSLGIIMNRAFTTRGDPIHDEVITTFRFRTHPGGSVDMLGWETARGAPSSASAPIPTAGRRLRGGLTVRAEKRAVPG